MTVKEIGALVQTIDKNARHYFVGKDGSNFTVWMETEKIGLKADDAYAEDGWKATIARFTKQEYDPIATALEEALTNDDRIALVSYKMSSHLQSGYVSHFFEIEAT